MRHFTAWLLIVLPVGGTAIGQVERFNEPKGVAFDAQGHLYVADTGHSRVVVYDGEFGFVRAFGEEGSAPGQLLRPQGLAFDPQGRLLVADTGNHRIQILAPDGRFLKAFGEQGSDPGQFRSPFGLTADEHGNIIVADTWNHRIQVFDSDGAFRLAVGGERGGERLQFHEPAGVHVLGGRLYVASGWNSRIDIYEYDADTPQLTHVPGDSSDEEGRRADRGTIWGFWVCGDVASDSRDHIIALNRNIGEVKIFDGETHKELKVFNGGLLGHLRAPHAVAVNARDQLAIADSGNERVLVLDAGFELPERPEVTEVSRDHAVIEWTTLKPGGPVVEFWAAPEVYGASHAELVATPTPTVVRGTARRNDCRAELTGLRPGTAYHYRVRLPSVVSLPRPGFSRTFAFATLPPPRQTAFLRLPVAVLIYANCYNEEGAEGAPAPPPLERSTLDERIRAELEKAVLFYWNNSRMRLLPDLELFIVEKMVKPDERNRVRDLDQFLGRRGKRMQDYVGVVEITAERRYKPEEKRYYLQGSGGGTYGINYPEPASSFFLAGSDVAWLFAHEFHHQVDSYYAESGYEEYPFNHFAPFEAGGFPGHFGEHWDGNAYILRSWTDEQYFYNLYGEVHTAVDEDEDGIPDDDPSLPLDERRFGSDPAKKDTDDDGLDDMGEILASQWAHEMLPSHANWRAEYVRPDPTNRDSDGDGLKDGEDPYPIYAARDRLGRAAGPALPPLYTVRGHGALSDFEAQIRAGWDDEALRLGFRFTRRPAEFYIQTDFANDGYYVGQDNYIVRVGTPERGPELRDVVVNVCTTPDPNDPTRLAWPHDDREMVKPESVQVRGGAQADGYAVQVAIPRHEATGLSLGEGDTYGLAFYFLLEDGTDQWISAFEPYHLLDVTVVR